MIEGSQSIRVPYTSKVTASKSESRSGIEPLKAGSWLHVYR